METQFVNLIHQEMKLTQPEKIMNHPVNKTYHEFFANSYANVLLCGDSVSTDNLSIIIIILPSLP
ncbi:hypothetical protein [Legionella pneumophila]|uniref:Uncharacterized protein n=1 Tax=Legionella pneumophila subsp. pascullei TaxID=91890 RepID=A0AAX2IUF9_LEGPN|nr:hypothetical protein [Legionella pneumophila]AMP90663.1 hypothetical protein AXF35_13560 [Legionella pneumophila subsp. pascullei]AMP91647.1 hypothetical protein AXF36_03110 [Legionella pneumophila subsp. pascullei]AMP94633.1 hypothetical protein AXF37_03115 [Legionella pneumophila subsp. pascullei]SQG89445.1 Uncharacterised protein [Legionella pneumophila subsp. pascullei]VEH04724.1 Uncharacterised protein [Legionella pneumophila subsp. pascullei]